MKDRIICESIESLRQEGLKFSVDTLAERLNISKKTIYKYFPNKESLALALYQKYYADARKQIELLTAQYSSSSHSKLLHLYFDAKSMTSRDIFNKYKLNEALYSYTAQQNESLWEVILASLDDKVLEQDKKALRIIVDGSLEKLCNDRLNPDAVIERLVQLLW